MRSVVIATLVLGLLAASPITSHAFGSSVSCRSYSDAMETARAALQRGNRVQAIAALQKAKAALAECRREAAGITSLLAAGRTRPPAA